MASTFPSRWTFQMPVFPASAFAINRRSSSTAAIASSASAAAHRGRLPTHELRLNGFGTITTAATSTNPHTSKPAASWWRASADPFSTGSQMKPPVPALIAAAHAEADKRRADPKPSHLDRRIIAAEQRQEAGRSAFQCRPAPRRQEVLRRGDEVVDEVRSAKAIAAEAAEPGAGIALVRQEMLNSPIKAATGNSCC